MACEQRLEGDEEGSMLTGRRYGKCKGPEVGSCLVYLRNREGAGRGRRGDQRVQGCGSRPEGSLVGITRTSASTLSAGRLGVRGGAVQGVEQRS